ncbi:MAG: SDR family oxidoreductase [Bacteroidetes bacterium]|nr:SDR family oxidoreductase [Bacteroidota bacterium]MBU1580401.1 SDR family oxidoreductase [Bacteroidota bacterium]MBU2558570.1 SDR family oxidoreductase [Bacteroidota bacterium]
MKKLENKVALITGGAGEIGKETAKLMLEAGAKVFLVDLKAEALEATAKALGNTNVAWEAADVSQEEAVKRYVNKAVEAFGKIDIFFNNAGIEGVVKPIEAYPVDIFDKVVAVNIRGVWMGAKYVLPHMKDGGSVIITSSVAGLVGSPNVSAYITSKHANVGIMRALAAEAAPRKIRVNSVHPSPVDNRMMRSLEDGFAPGAGAEVKKNLESTIPLGRYATNNEIALAVMFLAGDESRFITGATLPVDGGMTFV